MSYVGITFSFSAIFECDTYSIKSKNSRLLILFFMKKCYSYCKWRNNFSIFIKGASMRSLLMLVMRFAVIIVMVGSLTLLA